MAEAKTNRRPARLEARGKKVEFASGAEDSLSRIEQAASDLSKSDQKIARKLLNEPERFIRESVRSVANEIGVSEPTVIRFCRTVGFEGFKDLKIQIAQDLAFRQALSDSQGGNAAPQTGRSNLGGDASTVEDHVLRGASGALERARESYDSGAFSASSKAIAKASRVVVYGIGGSSGILAEEMHNRLFRLSLASAKFIDSYLQRMCAATLVQGDVAIFISSTGRPRALLDSVELAKHYGATTIGITSSDSHLGREVDICLNVNLTQSGVDEFQPNPMRFAQLYVIDCLAYQVAVELDERARSALRKTRASVASLHSIAPQQPIGD